MAGILAAHGLKDTATLLNTPDALAAGMLLFSFIWSMFRHSNGDPSNPGVKLLLTLALPALLFTGCTTKHAVFKTEYAAAASCDAAMRGYAAYWNKASIAPNTYNRTLAGLQQERQTLENYSMKIGGAIELTEKLRVAYATNSAVKPQLQAALLSLSANAAGIVATATTFLNPTNNTN